MKPIIRTALAVSVAVLLGGGLARADDHEWSRWPSDQEQRLAQLDAHLVDVQQKLFTAKQTKNVEGVESLQVQFDSCQGQRFALLRSMGLVSEHDAESDD